jgi:hypothetical protein
MDDLNYFHIVTKDITLEIKKNSRIVRIQENKKDQEL